VTGDVVTAAQQDEVGEISAPTENPVDHVVGITPLRWPVAAREAAAAITVGECTVQSGTDHRRAAPEVQDQRRPAADDATDRGVAAKPVHETSRYRPDARKLASRCHEISRRPSGKRVDVDDDVRCAGAAGASFPLRE